MTRIYVNSELSNSKVVVLNKQQQHYLAKVLRFKDGDIFHAFNAEYGEWQIQYGKAGCICLKQIRIPAKSETLWLAFAPIKHDALSFLIEKATELGVTNLQPLITDHTNSQRINMERLEKQVIEASQQCERLDIPIINPPIVLNKFLVNLPESINWYVAMERSEARLYISKSCGFIIGPEGGWSESEKLLLAQKAAPISLGNNILRAETAALACLSLTLYC